jgi:hypothetical protein
MESKRHARRFLRFGRLYSPAERRLDVAHSGQYAMKMTIDLAVGESACRQFRHEEALPA